MQTKDQPITRGVLYLAGERVWQWMESVKASDVEDAGLSHDDALEEQHAVEAYQLRMEMRTMQVHIYI